MSNPQYDPYGQPQYAPPAAAPPKKRRSADITCPADLADASLRELLDAWHRHTARLVEARQGLPDALPPARIARHALDALAIGQAVVDRLSLMRWTAALDALANGATLEHTAVAMGLDVDEVFVGMRSWADR